MELLKKFWPQAFQAKDVAATVIMCIIYLVAAAIIGAVLGLVSNILAFTVIVPWLLGLVGTLIGIYCLVGIVLAILHEVKVLN